MTEKAKLWYEIDEVTLDRSIQEFEDKYLKQVRSGVCVDPYSFASVEHINLLTSLEKSSYVKEQKHAELSALTTFLIRGGYRAKTTLEGYLSANLACYSYVLKASKEAHSIMSLATPTLSGPERVVMLELLAQLSSQCAVMVHMHSRIGSVAMAIEAVRLATVSEFPRSPVTKNAVADHFKPLWEAQNLYILRPDQTRLSTFKKCTEELLSSKKLVKLFELEHGGVSLMPAYFKAVHKRINQLDVAVLMQEVTS